VRSAYNRHPPARNRSAHLPPSHDRSLPQEIDRDPEQMLGDKGYDSEAVGNDIEERDGEAAIPSTATRKVQHAVHKALYTWRNRIERFFNRAKNSRRIATRYDKLMESFAAFVLLPCIRIWIKFVHNLARRRDLDTAVPQKEPVQWVKVDERQQPADHYHQHARGDDSHAFPRLKQPVNQPPRK
jgi:transposase